MNTLPGSVNQQVQNYNIPQSGLRSPLFYSSYSTQRFFQPSFRSKFHCFTQVCFSRVSVKAERTYWSFQLDLMQLKSYTQTPITAVKYSGGVVARFEHRGDSLILTKGYLMNRVNQQDILIDSTHKADLKAYGITEFPMRYRVLLFTDEEMTLTTDHHRLVFRKF